jgi:hypothetical protein
MPGKSVDGTASLQLELYTSSLVVMHLGLRWARLPNSYCDMTPESRNSGARVDVHL